VIKGVHSIFMTTDAPATRDFFRDVLGFDSFDSEEDYPVMLVPEGELSFHPAPGPGYHVSLYCDDIQATMADLISKGVVFTREVEDKGFGYTTAFMAPGGLEIELYQPARGENHDHEAHA